MTARAAVRSAAFWAAFLCPCTAWPVGPDIAVQTTAAGGKLVGGVPFKEWLHGLTFEIPPHHIKAPMGTLESDGGFCRDLVIDHVEAKDIEGLIEYGISGVSLHCQILARDRSMTIDFDLVELMARLVIQATPMTPTGTSLTLPMGPLVLKDCSVLGSVDNLKFGGDSTILDTALNTMSETAMYFVNKELMAIACTKLKPIMEVKATAALKQAALQLAPLLQKQPPPPVEPLAAAPLVDWGTYPPMQLSRALVAERPDPVAKLMDRVPDMDLPLAEVPVNRTVVVNANGTTVNSFLESLRVEGLGTFVPASLVLKGDGHKLDTSSAFRHIRVIASLQVQVSALPELQATQAAPLLEHFDLALDLYNVAAWTEALLMVSQPHLDSMKVDQLQRASCLVGCANAAVLPPASPVALWRMLGLNFTPVFNIAAPGSLEAGLAQVVDTTLAVLFRGYLPTLQALVSASVGLGRDAMEATVRQFLDAAPPCSESHVYFGPGEFVNSVLLWGGIGIAVFGISAGVALTVFEDAADDSPVAGACLASHPCVPRALSVAFPFLVVSTMVLFVLSDLGLGTVVNVVFKAAGRTTVIGPAFSFSVLTIFRDSWMGGAYCIAFLVAGLSGLWPFVKLGFLVVAWLAPPGQLRLSLRGSLLTFLDQYGKYSLIDSWLAVLALASYDLSWEGGGASVAVDPVPMLPFFLFVIATVMSLVLGHVATEFHKRSLEWGQDATDLTFAATPKPRSLLSTAPGRPLLWVLTLVATGVAIVAGAYVVSFRMHTTGAIPDLLQEPEQMTIHYSLISLGSFVTRGDPNPPLGLRTVQVIFFGFAFVIPVLLIVALLFLLLMPLDHAAQKVVLKLCHVLDAWSAFDVFALGVLVANFEFGLFAKFLVYNDNISVVCKWVKDELNVECLHIECAIAPGFAILAVAGLASYAVPKWCFRFCQAAMADDGLEMTDASPDEDSEEDGLLTKGGAAMKMW